MPSFEFSMGEAKERVAAIELFIKALAAKPDFLPPQNNGKEIAAEIIAGAEALLAFIKKPS